MPEYDALDAALVLLKDPVSARKVHDIRLPQGVATVLSVAIGDEEALSGAERHSGADRQTLREAAGFFIEQALLDYHADSYRVLGTNRDTSHEELRRNMALLMRWLHPDLQSLRQAGFDREVFATRVARAWEDLKTEERRQAYDRRNPGAASAPPRARSRDAKPSAVAAGTSPARPARTSGKATSARPRGTSNGKNTATTAGNGNTAASGAAAKLRRPADTSVSSRRRSLPLGLHRIEGPSFWVRLWSFFWRTP